MPIDTRIINSAGLASVFMLLYCDSSMHFVIMSKEGRHDKANQPRPEIMREVSRKKQESRGAANAKENTINRSKEEANLVGKQDTRCPLEKN